MILSSGKRKLRFSDGFATSTLQLADFLSPIYGLFSIRVPIRNDVPKRDRFFHPFDGVDGRMVSVCGIEPDAEEQLGLICTLIFLGGNRETEKAQSYRRRNTKAISEELLKQ